MFEGSYGRIHRSVDAGSSAAGYWLAAAARGSGDAERALNEATAAWARAALATDGGIALRADLDRLVLQGILPDRAARLTMRDFSDGFIEAYLDATGVAATMSVGGYQLERTGIQLFERVEGDHFTILGLPLLPLLRFLRFAGALAD